MYNLQKSDPSITDISIFSQIFHIHSTNLCTYLANRIISDLMYRISSFSGYGSAHHMHINESIPCWWILACFYFSIKNKASMSLYGPNFPKFFSGFQESASRDRLLLARLDVSSFVFSLTLKRFCFIFETWPLSDDSYLRRKTVSLNVTEYGLQNSFPINILPLQ